MSKLTREERLLSGENLTPVTRREMFLAKAGGADIETPTPVTREEMFLSAIKGGGGSSGGGGGASADKKDVNFYDYDGTILYSYTINEAQALSELPELPTRDGLVCQGWNWTLEDIKAMGRAVDVGATYITDDGATRIYIRLSEGRTSPMLGVCPKGTVTVDWGDGTAPDTLTGTSVTSVKWTPTHNYAKPGEYVIRLIVEGSVELYGKNQYSEYSGILRYSANASTLNSKYRDSVQRIELGNGLTKISEYAFGVCKSLSSIVIPNSVTSIDNGAFYSCYNLSNIVIPSGVTSIGGSMFKTCYGLSSIVIPNSVTSIGGSVFDNCKSLSSIVIPNSVTSIGTYAFGSCYALSSIVIPSNVTKISSHVFYLCNGLLNIVIPSGVTNIDDGAFYSCHSLSSIVIPSGVTNIGKEMFSQCECLSDIVIPSGVTSIGDKAFYYCGVLSSIVIPSGVTSIGSHAFNSCYAVKYYDFTKHTAVPTLSNTNAFNNISADCEIRVPVALVDEWKAATNWSTYADYIVGV